MTEINAWVTELAELVAPDEVDLAAIQAQAFLAGGQAREELFRQSGPPTAGSLGPGDFVALETISKQARQSRSRRQHWQRGSP